MKKIRRNVAVGLIAQNGNIEYATEMDRDLFLGLSIGTPVEIKARPDRNVAHHRKYFALIKMGLEYWQSDFSFVSETECWVAHKVAQEFAKLSQNQEFYNSFGKEIADKVLFDVSEHRQTQLNGDIQHNIDLYRRKIMIDAGYFDYILLPDGGALRRPHSISFDEMSQDKFNEIYRGCFNQIWKQTLIRVFDTKIDAQNAIDKMMSFV